MISTCFLQEPVEVPVGATTDETRLPKCVITIDPAVLSAQCFTHAES